MRYLIRMAPEVEQWLAAVRDRDHAAADLIDEAVSSAGTRILFTVEPPGTAVLLGAGTEGDWLRAWYAEAVANCRIRYQREHGNTP